MPEIALTTSNSVPQAQRFAARLTDFRNSLGYSKADLAAALGVTTMTLHRWEAGSTRPSPLAAEKLSSMGFGEVAPEETSAASVPRIKRGKGACATEAARLREQGQIFIGKRGKRLEILPAPFVLNGPPDQADFHSKLLDLQMESKLERDELGCRLSMVQEVIGSGVTSQHALEKPQPTALSWNSNYGPHGWHRYVGRFPAHVVRALLNYIGADSTSVVCDPFSGSGTTAVECRLLGIPFVGIEICPLSAMMTRVKASFPPDPDLLLKLAKEFVEFYNATWGAFLDGRNVSELTHDEVISRRGNVIPSFTNIERWFTATALLGTSIAVEFGMRHGGYEREAVLLALSSKMRSIGNVDVDVVRAEYSKRPRTNVDVGKLVARQLTKMAGDVAASLKTHKGTVGAASTITVHEASVLDVNLPESSLGHVITSPPYGVEAISYLRTHLLSYRSLVAHLDHDPYDTRDKTIGSEFVVEAAAGAGQRSLKTSKVCREFFSSTPKNGDKKYEQRHAAMLQFCDDMLAVGERMAYWVKPGGTVSFVIGNKRLGDMVVPLDAIVIDLFGACNLKLVETVRHKLKTNNSNSQVPWQDRVIQDESILIFENKK